MSSPCAPSTGEAAAAWATLADLSAWLAQQARAYGWLRADEPAANSQPGPVLSVGLPALTLLQLLADAAGLSIEWPPLPESAVIANGSGRAHAVGRHGGARRLPAGVKVGMASHDATRVVAAMPGREGIA